ncbi:hypothetical protein GZ77_17700 [Endozoicomonas montiporae]|uniref:Tricorn protease homolog n=2 Tax=Endozoicomonas montiporae TaxID=1027273 RepID=A0A081N1Q3_9GAMM|nr:S41 family peptidase [Endozoicomonas montiporae]AMO58686.1 tricorn protease [Endozoicomonas montiporae CL-33]KEQ12376.1 hypothetical protein GZ77_17700 [Endozoicomonas montiporae]
MRFLTLLLATLLFVSFSLSASNEGYYHFPSIHKDTIVFSAEGDLWKTTLAGGTATRLTTSHGREAFPFISPDGQQVAFLAEYDGSYNLYTMPLSGGLPKRLTFSEGIVFPRGWVNNTEILYATNKRNIYKENFQLVTQDTKSLTKHWLPLAQAFEGSFDDSAGNSRALFFTRFSGPSHKIRHYQGGTAQNIWKYPEGKEAIPLTKDFPGTSKQPLFWNQRIYFISDRDESSNLWSMNTDGQNLIQHTFHKGMDIVYIAQDNGQFVYQLGPDLYALDLKQTNAKAEKIQITLASDFEQRRPHWLHWPAGYLSNYDLSPDASQLALVARGQVNLLPVKDGRTISIPNPEKNVFFQSAQYLPLSNHLLGVAWEGIHQSFWLLPADGSNQPVKIHQTDKTVEVEPVLSPDNEFFVWTDSTATVRLTHIQSGVTETIKQFEPDVMDPGHFSWSPDSQWLAFSHRAKNLKQQIYLYSLSDNTLTAITSDRTDSHTPVWSPSGKWLMFISQRFFNSRVSNPFDTNQPEPYSEQTKGIFMYAMNPEAIWPFEPDNEVLQQKIARMMEKEQQKEEAAENHQPERITVELNELQDRLYQVPVPAGDYYGLDFAGGYLFWGEPDSENTFTLRSLEVSNTPDNQPFTVATGLTGYQPAKSGEQILIHGDRDEFALIPTGVPENSIDFKPVSLEQWRVFVSPRDEWQQLLSTVWSLLNNLFADPTMNGTDWPEQLDNHLQMLDRVTDRQDLNQIISSMIGRLGVLHLNNGRGDLRFNDRWSIESSLGAVLSKKDEGLQIDQIYKTDPDYPLKRSPLARPGTQIEEGDIITAINHLPLDNDQPIEERLTFKENQQVLLTINKAETKDSIEQIVWPVDPEQSANLLYDSWVFSRQQHTELKGQGKLGYVHMKGMESEDFEQWVQQYYPVFNRGGLILDLRNNTGGNIDSWIISRLQRKALTFNTFLGNAVNWNMPYAFRGHIVVLINEHTASDAEELAEDLRELELATLIGTRTWGGRIWMFFSELMDNGFITVPHRAGYKSNGRWVGENWGLEPDIQIDNLPHATFNGNDAQLDKAIQFLLEKLEKEPVEVPARPDFPIAKP